MDGRLERLRAEYLEAAERTAQLKMELDLLSGAYPKGTIPHYNVIEMAGREAGAEVSRRTQQRHLRNLNAEHLGTADCPECARRCEVASRRREVTALDGPLELDDLTARCPVCRRDFFPAADSLGL